MRVLLLNYEFPPLGGGSGNACYFLLKQFSSYSNLEIDLITASTGFSREEKFSKKITIYYLDIAKKNKNLHYQSIKDLIVYSYKAFIKAKQLQSFKKYDLVHAFFGIPCGLLAWILSKRFIISLRGSDVPFYNSRFYWLDRLLFQWLSRLIWKHSRYVVANSYNLKKLALITNSNQKIKLIPNGVDANVFKPNPKISRKKIILFVGRLIKRKGLNYLLRAFARIKKNGFSLWVVGDGPEKKKLNKLCQKLKISQSVKFLGIVARQDLVKIYQQAAIFVLPSLNEGMSNAFLEAISSGLAVIVTNVGDSKKIIRGNGIIIRRHSVKSITKALHIYIEKPKLLRIHQTKSVEIASQFKWKEAAKSYYRLYLNVCKH